MRKKRQFEPVAKPIKIEQKCIELPDEQNRAIALLLLGASDRAVSEQIGVARTTIWRWRNHDPRFISTLNRERLAAFEAARARLHSLVNLAVETLEGALRNGDAKSALELIKIVSLNAPDERDFCDDPCEIGWNIALEQAMKRFHWQKRNQIAGWEPRLPLEEPEQIYLTACKIMAAHIRQIESEKISNEEGKTNNGT